MFFKKKGMGNFRSKMLKWICYLLQAPASPKRGFYYANPVMRGIYRIVNMRLYVVAEVILIGLNLGLTLTPHLSIQEQASLVRLHRGITYFFVSWTLLRILSIGITQILNHNMCLFDIITSTIFMVK